MYIVLNTIIFNYIILLYSEEAGSDGNDETPSEQVFDKSLNLTPGRVLEPAAMNWKTERSSRLSEKAKSMMGHFKIAGMGDGASANGRAGPEKDKSELWKRYLTRYQLHHIDFLASLKKPSRHFLCSLWRLAGKSTYYVLFLVARCVCAATIKN